MTQPGRRPRYQPEDSLKSPRFTGPSTFARLPLVRTLEEVDLAVVGVPFDTGVTYRAGGRFGPNGVRAASVMLRPYNANLDVKPFDILSCVDSECRHGVSEHPRSGRARTARVQRRRRDRRRGALSRVGVQVRPRLADGQSATVREPRDRARRWLERGDAVRLAWAIDDGVLLADPG